MTIKEMINYIYGDNDGKTKCFQTYYKVKEKERNRKMKEKKFKVGDKVIIKDGSKIKNYEGGWIKDMSEYIGRTCTISHVCCYNACTDTYGYRMKEIDYTWDERGLALADETIIISIEGKKVTANYKGRSGIARCNPEDDFELKKGVVLAVERLIADMNRIKEGDWVEIVDPGQAYTTLPKWVAENIKDKEKIAEYRYGESAPKYLEGNVLKIAKHTRFDEDIAYVEGHNGCYVINIKGLKKVNK